MPVIQTDNLTRRYGPRRGVESIDLSVDEGALFGFLGPNGAGKTTAIRLLLGFLRPTSGHADVFGRDCWTDSARIKRDVGYLPGDVRLYPWMTLDRGLDVFGSIRGRDLRTPGRTLAERFQLDPTVPARKMSKGMRQKVAIIVTLAAEPKLLILDEPTSGLDPLMQDTLADCLRERAARGDTVFFSSHTLSEVEQLCDRVAIVREGRIVADETLDALRTQATREVIVEFPDEAAATQTAPPNFLQVHRRHRKRWTAELRGPAGALTEWAAARHVADLTIAAPNLESLFRRFYRNDPGPDDATSDRPGDVGEASS